VLALALLAGLGACAPVPRPPGAGAPPDETARARFRDAHLACDQGGNVYAASAEIFEQSTQIYFAASPDHGTTWGPAFSYLNTSRDGDRGRPQIATGRPGEVFVLWEDTREGPRDLYFNRSLDAGATWLPRDVRVNTNPPGSSHLAGPRLACDERGHVYAVWLDNREGFEAFYFNRSTDAGATWLASDVRVTALALGLKSAPELACDRDGSVYVAWIERRGTQQHVVATSSSDGGSTWLVPEVELQGGGGAESVALTALEPATAVLSWLEASRGRADVYRARSTDRGRTWEGPTRVTTRVQPLFDPSAPQLARDRSDHVYIGWHAATAGGAARLFLEHSEDAGRSFAQTVIERDQPIAALDRDGAARRQRFPFRMLADESGNIYFAWVEVRFGAIEIGFDRLADHGRSWLRLDHRLGLVGHAPIDVEPPQLCADDFGHVYLLWNEGSALHVATSPFYGDSGWRHEHL
jgi:hypothetical protein